VEDPEQLRAAAGAFGMLGIIISITLKMDEMTFARYLFIYNKRLVVLTRSVACTRKVYDHRFYDRKIHFSLDRKLRSCDRNHS
jgi:hypothetical protein